jgi:branched-chain amino acid transport system ATP-binding protein
MIEKGVQPIIRVEKVTKTFGGIVAVNNVSFDLHKGEILGIMGPNGSGKTTLINCITGFLKPVSGKVFFKGIDITGMPAHRIASMGIGRTFQVMRPFYSLPAYKNLIIPLSSSRAKKFAGGGKLGDRDAVAIDILEEVGFERDVNVPYKPASALPLGYLKRLELCRCIALRAEVIICDEVLAGLSPAEIMSMISLIKRLNREGVTIIMIEHRVRELFEMAGRVIVISFGNKIFDGNPAEALKDQRVQEAYFGKLKGRTT